MCAVKIVYESHTGMQWFCVLYPISFKIETISIDLHYCDQEKCVLYATALIPVSPISQFTVIIFHLPGIVVPNY